jgi:hypothetical protein
MFSLSLLLSTWVVSIGAFNVNIHDSASYADLIEKSSRYDANNISPRSERVITMIDGSKMKGIQHDSLISFKGVRYAEAPVGSRRWSPPVPLTNQNNSSDPYDATKFGASCTQGFSSILNYGSEDCLFLNIWVAADKFSRNGSAIRSNTPVGMLYCLEFPFQLLLQYFVLLNIIFTFQYLCSHDRSYFYPWRILQHWGWKYVFGSGFGQIL